MINKLSILLISIGTSLVIASSENYSTNNHSNIKIDGHNNNVPFEFEHNNSTQLAGYFFTTVTIGGELISSDDWVAAFNGNICVGSHQWDTSNCMGGICEIIVYGDDGSANTDGYCSSGDIPTFKIYDTSENTYHDAEISGTVTNNNCTGEFPNCMEWGLQNFISINNLNVFIVTPGCTNNSACNYNSFATVDDGSCEMPDCNNDCLPDDTSGNAIIDDCGVCSGGYTPNAPNKDKDCNGICFGNLLNTGVDGFGTDICGVCGGNGPEYGCWDGSFECIETDCPFDPADCPNSDSPIGTTYIEYTGYTSPLCAPNNFPPPIQTSQVAYYIVETVYINNQNIENGDWIAAFNGDVCVGARKWEDSLIDIPAMGVDNLVGGSIDYMNYNDTPSFKIYDVSQNTYYDAEASLDFVWQPGSDFQIPFLYFCSDSSENLGCGCGEAGPSGCDNTCGSTLELDECDVCGGSGPAENFTCVGFQPISKEALVAAVEMWLDDNATALSIYGEVNTWDVSLITDMEKLFHYSDFSDDISNWDVSNVTNMQQMFTSAWAFNQDLSSWDVSNVTNMIGMFHGSSLGCEAHGDIDNDNSLSGWDVSNVTYMKQMFWNSGCFNGDITGWDVSNVITMEVMLANTSFTHNVSSWNISNVINFSGMFGSSNDLSDEVECAIQATFQSNDAWPYVWCVDCAGVPTGDAVVDECGVCGGNNSTCSGCTDEDACNYNANSIVNDGLCQYPESGYNCDGILSIINNNSMPTHYSIQNIYPNPFNPITNISYGIPENSYVSLIIYNLMGEKITSLIDNFQIAGNHTISWNASNYPSGIYLVSLEGKNVLNHLNYENDNLQNSFKQIHKVVLIK